MLGKLVVITVHGSAMNGVRSTSIFDRPFFCDVCLKGIESFVIQPAVICIVIRDRFYSNMCENCHGRYVRNPCDLSCK